MFRLILWFLIFYFAYSIFKKLKTKSKKIKFKKKVNPNSPELKEKMMKCENCGIYSPESSIVVVKNKYFCSKKCAEEFFDEKK